MSEELLPVLTACVKNHTVLSSHIFEDMWQNDELSTTLKLFTAYYKKIAYFAIKEVAK